MSQNFYQPIDRHASDNLPYSVYYVPVRCVAVPNPPAYTIPLDPCPIGTSYPVLPTTHRPIPSPFDHEPCQRTDYGVTQQVRRPVYDPTSSLHVSYEVEASSSNLTRKSPYPSYGHPERPEHSRTTSRLHFADLPSRDGLTRPRDDPQSRKSISPPANSSVARFSRRQLTHLESERKRRESINAGIEALRRAIPGCEGDCKAVILEKAVEYISHLESLVRDARVRGAADCRRQSSEEEALIKTEPE